MTPLLSVQHVYKSFGELKAVHNISIEVPSGIVTAVVGPNGAGKTTLFNCISGVARPDRADIRLHRSDRQEPVRLTGLPIEEICRLGIARTFQQVRLFDSLSVVDNVVIGSLLREDFSWAAALFDRLTPARKKHVLLRQEAVRYLNQVGLEKQAERLAGELDHGNRRRLEIARALATKPLVLLLDEPAAGMNRIETDELQALLSALCSSGLGILLIEHDMKLVMQVSSCVYVMDHGELLVSGKPEEVTTDERVIEAYLGTMGQRYASR